MAIPVNLLVAAAKVLSDPNTIKTVKSIYDAGSKLIDKGGAAATAYRGQSAKRPAPEAAKVPQPGSGGWMGTISTRIALRPGAKGDLVRFTYVDDHGLSSVRTVGNWSSNGLQLTGYCLNLRADHSFAISRISAMQPIG